jgi:predicted transcriptional regulator
MTKKNEKFIPNSFQVPNVYIDEYLHMLSNSEIKVLLYAMRRIFGFQKRTDRISISQFCDGVKNKDGDTLDHGTGLSPATVIKSLDKLIEYGLIIKVADNNGKNEGTLYQLSAMPDVDDETIKEEHQEKQQANKERMKKVRKGKNKKESVISNKEPYIKYNATHISNITPPLYPIKGQYTEGNTEGNTDIKEPQATPGISLIEWQEQQKKLQEEKKKNVPQTPHGLMVEALRQVTEMDMKLDTNAGRIVRASKQLREAGYTYKDVEEFGRKWKQDWRYQKNKKPPVLTTIIAEIKQVEREDSVEERKRIAFEQIEEARQTRLANRS